jgi:hypothetical protein
MATKLWICSTLLIPLMTASGCSQQREKPDYEALRSKLAVQLEPIEGWSDAEMEHSAIEHKGLRIAHMTNLVRRSYKSQETGEEVWLTIDAGRWGHLARHLPIRISCLTGTGNLASNVFPEYGEFESVAFDSDTGQSYTFGRCEEIRPSPRWIHWARASGGKWLGSRVSRDSILSADYGFSIVVEVVSPPGWPAGHVSSDSKRLIANLMDQISPIILD